MNRELRVKNEMAYTSGYTDGSTAVMNNQYKSMQEAFHAGQIYMLKRLQNLMVRNEQCRAIQIQIDDIDRALSPEVDSLLREIGR